MTPHHDHRSARSRTFVAAALLGLVALGAPLVGAVLAQTERPAQPASMPNGPDKMPDMGAAREVTPPPAIDPAFGELTAHEQRLISVFERVADSVVYITTRRVNLVYGRRVLQEGSGSGFVWDSNGHIVTNFHVVDGFQTVSIILSDGTVREATVVGGSPDDDIAVLRLDPQDAELVPVTLGNSDLLRVGQSVLAIGNPFGLDRTLTQGIVSALGRAIPARTGVEIQGVIQTDAAVNPGNSGGPLIDTGGRVVGINTAIRSPSGASAGISFAVPINTVIDLVPELIQYGRRYAPVLGVSLYDTSARRQFRFGRGILVESVLPGTGAERAGLRGTRQTRERIIPGDLILEADGRRVDSLLELRRVLARFRAGDSVTLSLFRDNTIIALEVELSEPAPVSRGTPTGSQR